jgi:hypothetical protein
VNSSPRALSAPAACRREIRGATSDALEVMGNSSICYIALTDPQM